MYVGGAYLSPFLCTAVVLQSHSYSGTKICCPLIKNKQAYFDI